MRVLETKIVTTYSMGKKNKHKLRKSKENEASDSSEEIAVRGCQHVNKSVNFSAMKKGLAKQVYGECAGCAKETSKRSDKLVLDNLEGATSLDFIEEAEPVLWVCLQCGHQGCGRSSSEKHALKHYETPRSSQHNIVINTTSWSVWCYECDDELQPEKYKKVSECLEHIKKVGCVPVVDAAQGRNSGSSGPSGGEAGSNKNRSHTAGQKVLGLSNLGNTCFFNAVLQNLIQTYSLDGLLRERKRGQSLRLKGSFYTENESCSSSDEGENDKNLHKDLPSIEISVSDPGPLTQALVVFLQDTSCSTKSSTINPSALFGQVCKKAPRFKGMQQQDSHELLRYLLDNMKTEEIKRGQTGILKHFKLSENANPKKVDEETKTRVKVYGREIKHTFVECLFGGQLISTVVCEECKYISQILEPFLDLSLPVTEEKPQRPNQGHGVRKRESTSELKEEPAETSPVKDEKVSKYQVKKMKKQRKRDARRKGGKGPLKKSGSKDKADDDEEEKEDEGDDKDEEEEEEGEGSKVGEQEERDASDADVEDNLESDTSRCYGKTPSDSVFTASSTQEESTDSPPATATTDKPGNTLDTDRPGDTADTDRHRDTADTDRSGEARNTLDTAASFTVHTAIDNFSVTVPGSVATCNGASGDSGELMTNGAMDTAVSDVHKDEVSVSYTIQNGCLTEANSASNPVTSFTIHDRTLCNGGGESHINNTNNDAAAKDIPHQMCNGSIVGNIKTNSSIVNGEKDDSTKIQGETSLQDNVSQITNSVSEISLEENGVDNSFLHHNGDISVTEDLDNCIGASSHAPQQTSHQPLQDISKLEINSNAETKQKDNKTEIPNANVSCVEIRDTENKLGDSKVDPAVTPMVGEGKVCGEGTGTRCKTPATPLNAQPGSRASKMKDLMYEGQKKSLSTLADRYHTSSLECSVESCLHQFTAAELLTGNNKFGCKNCTKLKYKNNPNKEKKETVYSNANKQYLIFQPPAVLTLHLKRFEQVGYSSRKVNRHVDFPFVLDIAPYCSSLTQGIKPGQQKILYSLYGVVEHSGRLSSGHYTAYVKVRPNIAASCHSFLNTHNVTLNEYLYQYAQNIVNGETPDSDAGDHVNTDNLVPPGRWYHISDSRVNEVTEASVEKAQAYLLFYERIY